MDVQCASGSLPRYSVQICESSRDSLQPTDTCTVPFHNPDITVMLVWIIGLSGVCTPPSYTSHGNRHHCRDSAGHHSRGIGLNQLQGLEWTIQQEYQAHTGWPRPHDACAHHPPTCDDDRGRCRGAAGCHNRGTGTMHGQDWALMT